MELLLRSKGACLKERRAFEVLDDTELWWVASPPAPPPVYRHTLIGVVRYGSVEYCTVIFLASPRLASLPLPQNPQSKLAPKPPMVKLTAEPDFYSEVTTQPIMNRRHQQRRQWQQKHPEVKRNDEMERRNGTQTVAPSKENRKLS